MAKGTSLILRHKDPVNYKYSAGCHVETKITQDGAEMRIKFNEKMLCVLLSETEVRHIVKTLLGGGQVKIPPLDFERIAQMKHDPVEVLIESKMNYADVPDFVPGAKFQELF